MGGAGGQRALCRVSGCSGVGWLRRDACDATLASMSAHQQAAGGIGDQHLLHAAADARRSIGGSQT